MGLSGKTATGDTWQVNERIRVSTNPKSLPEMPAAGVPERVITKRHDPGEKILMEKRKLF